MPDPQLVGDVIAAMPELSQPKPDPEAFRERFATVAAADTLPAAEQPVSLDNLTYLIRKRAELHTQINELTARRDDIDAAIKEELGTHEVGTVRGRQIVRWTTVRSQVFDHKAFKAAHPELFDAFMTQRETRRFTLDTAAVLGMDA